MMKQWHNCYDSGWKGIIVPEAFSHPAKMSYGLLKRILEHARDEKWIRPRDIVVDPFGGIGSTGIIGAYADLRVICVELERKFVDLARKNFVLHNNAWYKFGNPYPVILQGDSRRLCEVVEKADLVMSSPPFMDCEHNYKHGLKVLGDNFKGRKAWETKGGTVEKADCIISSPPFTGVDCKKVFKDEAERIKFAQGMRNSLPGRSDKALLHILDGFSSCGKTPGQLGSMKPGKVDMVVSSPPYAESEIARKQGDDVYPEGRKKRRANKDWQGYSKSKGNLGNLKSGDVDCVISSPPYEGALGNRKHEGDQKKYYERQKRYNEAHPEYKRPSAESMCYPCSDGNIASEQGDTFWQATKTIVEQCFQILKPGGHAIWVVKSFVRKKKIVDFPGDWQRLCESVGFKTVCVHHAMLVKETSHKTLFGDTEVKRTERKSFFRRLAESKGSPRIDFEVVLCMEKQPLFPVETKI